MYAVWCYVVHMRYLKCMGFGFMWSMRHLKCMRFGFMWSMQHLKCMRFGFLWSKRHLKCMQFSLMLQGFELFQLMRSMQLCGFKYGLPMQYNFGCSVTRAFYAILKSKWSYNCIKNDLCTFWGYVTAWLKNPQNPTAVLCG